MRIGFEIDEQLADAVTLQHFVCEPECCDGHFFVLICRHCELEADRRAGSGRPHEPVDPIIALPVPLDDLPMSRLELYLGPSSPARQPICDAARQHLDRHHPEWTYTTVS